MWFCAKIGLLLLLCSTMSMALTLYGTASPCSHWSGTRAGTTACPARRWWRRMHVLLLILKLQGGLPIQHKHAQPLNNGHGASGVQDVLLIEAAIPDELSLLEEVEQQAQHPLGPCVLSRVDKLTNGCVFLPSYSCDIGLGAFSTMKTCVLTTLVWRGGSNG